MFFLLAAVGMVLIEVIADDRQHIWLARGCVVVAVGLLWVMG